MEDNPELPVALDVSLVCLKVAIFPDSVFHWMLQKCTHMQGEIIQCLCLIHPPAFLQAVDCVLFNVLPPRFWHQLGAYHPAHQLSFQSHCSSVIMEKVTSGRHREAHGLFVYKPKEKISAESLHLYPSCSHHGPSSYSSSPSSLLMFFAHQLHLVPS